MRENHYKDRISVYGMGHTRRDRMLSLAGGPGLRILDVACASGSFGALLKARGNWVAGVELSEQGAVQARQRLDQVWSFDIERPWPDEAAREPFDLIIFGEILEHVFDPVQVLRQARDVLKPGGYIIVTTPNFMTWTNRLRFLIGDFRYRIEGMFDFGHIRWFTHAYLKEVLAASGYATTDERHIIFPGRLTGLLKRWPSLFAWQFIVKAKKT